MKPGQLEHPQQPAPRAVLLDIDGTLVDGSNTVSPGVRAAVCEARARGCEILVCTGRTRFTAESVARQLGAGGYLIASNGGVVVHLDTQAVLVRERLSIPSALEVVRAMVGLGVQAYVYEDAVVPTVERSRVLHHPDLPTGPYAIPPRYRPHARILEHLPFEPASVNAYGPAEVMRRLSEELRARL